MKTLLYFGLKQNLNYYFFSNLLSNLIFSQSYKKENHSSSIKSPEFYLSDFWENISYFYYPEQVVLNSQPCLTFRDKESKRKKVKSLVQEKIENVDFEL